jgi:adenosylmethionine-8-amino-7-oxononanoate aminotransferase
VGDHVLLAPPFIATASQIDTIGARLTDAIEAALTAIDALAAR